MQHVQLRAFHAVAEHGGFSKAALALGLTQPAVSDQVRRLEQEFGVTLFNRHARRVEPTELGRRLLVVTRQMFGCERDARNILAAAGTLVSGSLTLAADAPDLAAKLIAAFRGHHPGITVTLKIANAETCMEQVLAHSVDVAVTAAQQVDARLRSRLLRREPMVAILPRHRGAGVVEPLSWPDFAEYPVIFREASSMTQRLFEAELARHDLRIDPVLRVEGREALAEAVAHGLGVGVMARAEAGGDARLALLALEDCQAEMVEALVCLADRPPSHLIDALFMTRPPGEALA